MFDVSFSELMLIGVIALIVIGPERLPKVARTVGHLLGRAQRYVNEVKSDIQKEMDLKEIGDIKHQMEDAARSVQSSMTSSVDELKSAVTEPAQTLKDTLDQARQTLDPLPAASDGPAADPASAPEAFASGATAQGSAAPRQAAPDTPAADTPTIKSPAPEPAPAARPAPVSTDSSH
ncbi:MAG: Sec-independent protein translocase protein TatB [Castellaniella sp.]|uniref:Sec-independent protein translocase protein TatB n=1 Tax=Castellaniella sp. TaxID=1955812 RepID=UPI003A8B61C3